MLHRKLALPLWLLVILVVQLPAAVGRTDSDTVPSTVESEGKTASQPKADKGVEPNAKPEEKPIALARPAATVACKCDQARTPLYVEDWGRLADLTRSDPVVFEKADFWRNRHDTCQWLLGSGLLLGGGVAALGTINRLGNDAWSNTEKWSLAGGLGVALVAVLMNWAFSPDRDDRLTVINHWNLRHPDQVLAP